MIESITSIDNKRIKEYRKLKQKKFRNKERKYIIESKKMVLEAIELGAEIETLILHKSIEERLFDNQVLVSHDIFNSLTSLESPDGYMAIVKIPEKPNINDIGDRVLVLDRIQDPGNLGTLIRSAEAFEFNDIVLINCVDLYNDKTLRSTMGSIYRLKFYYMNNDDFIEFALDKNTYLADMDGRDYRQIKFRKPINLVIGNEANGISEQIKGIEGQIVSIPMKGKIESLNAGVSGSIIMSYISS